MIVLASTSPRRQEILRYFSLPFEVIKPTFDEQSVVYQGDLLSYIRSLSEAKASSISSALPILTADTVVYKAGKVFEKPRDEEEALVMLRQLNGAWHSVYTALSLSYQDKIFTEVELTKVLFHQVEDAQLRHYYHSLQNHDKAGGYAIQRSGGVIVKEIKGCFYNVMGLPLSSLASLLKKVEIDLWQFL